MLETWLIYNSIYNFRLPGEIKKKKRKEKSCVGTDNKRKPPVLVILHCLAKWWLAYSIPPPTLSLKVLSALFCTVYWSPKTVLWLPAKYICYYGNQSKQGNWKKNRGRLKTRLIWICGFEIKSVEVCWCFHSRSTAQICKLRISVWISFFYLFISYFSSGTSSIWP